MNRIRSGHRHKRPTPGRARVPSEKPNDDLGREIAELERLLGIRYRALAELDLKIQNIERKLANGATIEDGPLTFDPVLRRVVLKSEDERS